VTPGRPRAVADTGVYVSGLLSANGVCGRLLDALQAREWEAVVSPLLLDELSRVLLRPGLAKQFARRPGPVAVLLEFRLLSRLVDLADLVEDPPDRPAVLRDPDDDYLVALATAANADVIVSGDRDLTTATGLEVQVLTPRAFLDRLQDPEGHQATND